MKIRIGTRGSRLALAQTYMVQKAIQNKLPDAETEIVIIRTKGDEVQDKPLSEIGGKGVFVSKIECALLNNEIDIAVHSGKDLPAQLAENLEISAVLMRGNHRDALVTLRDRVILPSDSCIIGTGSKRRRLNMLRNFPNAQFREIRGNVETRLQKLSSGEFDGIILAMAGLERLGLDKSENFTFHTFESSEFIPAACQGIIAVEGCKNNPISEIIRCISHEKTMLAFETERMIPQLAAADCTTPVGAFAEISGEKIRLTATVDSLKFASGESDISHRFRLAEELMAQL
jgi:hydroxymethylbilane synthase